MAFGKQEKPGICTFGFEMGGSKNRHGAGVWAVCFFMAIVSACTFQGNGPQKADGMEMGGESRILPPDTIHTSQNSLDWEGTYQGVVPCADCGGMEIELSIKLDSNFTLAINHQGKGNGSPEVDTGKFVWVDGGTIQFIGFKNGPSWFKVGEGRIWQLDENGKRIEGNLAERYILKKK